MQSRSHGRASYEDFTDLNADGSRIIYQRRRSKKGVDQARISLATSTGCVVKTTRRRKKKNAAVRVKLLDREALVRDAQRLNPKTGEFEDGQGDGSLLGKY
ncbi:MAG: hypothetical protein HRU00_01410 [Myxococcales bacterium]|nr:hypothetical protein [Myxococcales bacterium]